MPKEARSPNFILPAVCFVILNSSFFRILAFFIWNCHGALRRLHHIVEMTSVVTASDVQHIDQTFVRARDRLEPFDAAELPFVGPPGLACLSVNYLDGARGPTAFRASQTSP